MNKAKHKAVFMQKQFEEGKFYQPWPRGHVFNILENSSLQIVTTVDS